jgi:exonuclease SbcC
MTDATIVNITVNRPAKPDPTLQKLSAALEAGNIKQAHRIKSNFLKTGTKSYPRETLEKFHLLDAKLKELEDWQRYASNSKRLELCEKMENLKDHNEIHPEEKAKAIQELQKQWRQLGTSDSREGQKLWQRFKLAGDLAFAVCSEYFDGRRDHREQNLQQRIKICDSLSLFLAENDWQETNWKAVNHIVKTARTEWKQFEDIPHANRKEIHHRFFNTLESIEAKIGEEQDRNHRLKQGYILQVQSLLETDDVTKMIREIKNVQSAWKQVGTTDRGVDQRLWKEFRKLCDATFAKRDEE